MSSGHNSANAPRLRAPGARDAPATRRTRVAAQGIGTRAGAAADVGEPDHRGLGQLGDAGAGVAVRAPQVAGCVRVVQLRRPQRAALGGRRHRHAPAGHRGAVGLPVAVGTGGDQPHAAIAGQRGQRAPLAGRGLGAQHRHGAVQPEPGAEAGGRVALDEGGAAAQRGSDGGAGGTGLRRIAAAHHQRAGAGQGLGDSGRFLRQ